jgi:type III restriction enzyme
MNDFNVLAKSSAAVEWCKNASRHEAAHKHGKPWSYVLIPHTAILSSATIKGLVQQYKK